ncbi:MAG: DUF4965 domain-containing protein [Anaerolineae bacterium]|nr:DUF4965 domain-containing protein [Anaerolineae bacterium]
MNPELMHFRPSAVPLVTSDPYLSCWSMVDRLYDDWPRHWTEAPNSLYGVIRVDGRAYRFLGGATTLQTTATQTALRVTPTRSIYSFEAGHVSLTVTFISPLLLDDLELLSRPVTYVTFDVTATDGGTHDVALYLDISGEWAVDKPYDAVTWRRLTHPDLHVGALRSVEQKALRRRGDDVRIDWGTLLLAAPSPTSELAIGRAEVIRRQFETTGQLPAADWEADAHAANCWGGPVIGACLRFADVGEAARSGFVLVGYDDEVSIEYFHQPLRAWWRRHAEASALSLLTDAARDYDSVSERCSQFDAELETWARAAGGEHYTRLVALAYRQAIAAHKLVEGPEGQPLFMSKENNSNGCIATVDVTYPSAPLFLIYNPDLVKGMLAPILDYCGTDAWVFPFAAHDLGTYPQANGQAYGRNRIEGQMPVEESGNVLILCAAIAHLEGSAEFAGKYWDLLTEWAEYLREKGFDPGDQLCTDDFAGRLARNANLSIKAILGLASYGKLAGMLGHADIASGYLDLARGFAAEWERLAGDGDHTRLTFDRENTWSLKYNLVWDKVLGFGLFSPEIARREVAYYLRMQNTYGVPLDSRRDYTKSDWVLWCAVLAESREDFEALVAPIYRYVHETQSRVPISDWHDTITGLRQNFKARSVVGGYFMKLLADKLAREE